MTADPLLSADVIADALGQFRPTPAQRRVIEAPASPALVVAGAGSGKTETMSARVLWLVANGVVRRDQILGLTFTRKAAGELAERIGRRLAQIDEFASRGLLPHLPQIVDSGALARIADAAPGAPRAAVRRDVLDGLAAELGTATTADVDIVSAENLLAQPRVATYNAFADGIVRDHASRIGRDPDAGLLSTSASWLLARQVAMAADDAGLDELDAGLSAIVSAVQRLAADLLDHRAAPEAVRRYAERQAAAFRPFVDDAVATKRDWEKATDALDALPPLLDLVRAYGDEKARRGVLDFADQVTGALDIVETAPDVAASLRDQHRVVLLDEYQDTSVIQTRLLAALFRDSSVMAVGDPHQAIYGWRGASADNLHGFSASFSSGDDAQRFDLLTSWRNDRVVLDAANSLLEPFRAPGRLPVHALEPRPGAGDGRLEIAFEQTLHDEAARVADWFAARRAEHGSSTTEPHTGAVLFRSKTHMQTFADALADRGVPHRILGLGGLLSAPEVVDVVSALRVLHDPTQGSALIRLLVGPRFAVGVADMGALYDLARTLSQRDASLAPLADEVRERIRASAGVDEQVSIIDALEFMRRADDDYRLLAAISPEGRARLREAAEMLDRLRRAAGQPVPELIRLIESELRLDLELGANESHGPIRSSRDRLRTFADEVRGFLQVDDRGTIGSVLAWLDHAEQTDDLMPRIEPPEPGVVQLLTIHGSKGLEWDAVAVVRLVDDELPSRSHGVLGGFGFGRLPHPFRGDVDALPVLDWTAPAAIDGPKEHRAAVKELREAFARYADDNRGHQREEERRLAYVAVTRARTDLLLTGAHWSGQTRPRRPSVFLDEIIGALGRDEIASPADDAENPYEGAGEQLSWPLDPLGPRRVRVEAAAERVARASAAEPTPQLARLLAERDERERGREFVVPTRIPASKFKDYVTDFAGTASALSRPMPERPYRQTRLGTLFHRWVEQRSGLVGQAATPDDALWEIDADDMWHDDRHGTEASAHDEADLARLRETFERSEWAGLQPIEVETEVDFSMPGLDGETPHIMICKIDAVYRRADRGGRIEIVDWKTGRAPRTVADREDRLLQLALYRIAYHRRHGIPLDQIDVALFYVSDDIVLRDERVVDEAELVRRWHAARGRD